VDAGDTACRLLVQDAPPRPYDQRHACLSTWLNASVDPTQVAEWAGKSVDVLLRVYAKCIVGREELNRRRIEEALCDDSGGEDGQ